MDVRDAVATRFSCRAFLPIPVPEHIVREILTLAARSPSAGKMCSPGVFMHLPGNALKRSRRCFARAWPNCRTARAPNFRFSLMILPDPYR